MSTIMSLPSSSFRGLVVTTTAREARELEKDRCRVDLGVLELEAALEETL